MTKRTSAEHVLANYLEPSAHDDWPFSISGNGYAKAYYEGVQVSAHVIACTLAHGPRPDGAHAMHSCRNRHCFYAKHLSWGTPSENNQDKRRDGTHQTGERANGSKLTWDEVDEIRSAYATGTVSQPELAQRFGVSQASIWYIIHDKTWTYR